MPNWGRVGSSAGIGAGVGSVIPGVGTGIGAGVGALVGAFRGGDDNRATPGATPGAAGGPNSISALIKQLVDRAQRRGPQGAETTREGTDALSEFTQYFRDILGPDPNAVLAATAADRGRVIDQYDTARQTAAEFGPRGSGGGTAASALSRVAQANQLSDITANARSNAANAGSGAAAQLAQLGLSEEMLASGDLQTALQAILGSRQIDEAGAGRRSQTVSGLAQAVGTILGLYLTRQQGNG